METKYKQAMAEAKRVQDWAHKEGVAMVLFAVVEGRIVNMVHTDCPDIDVADNQLCNAIATRIIAEINRGIAARKEAAGDPGPPTWLVVRPGQKEG